jgi:biotin transport system substrate-specific component
MGNKRKKRIKDTVYIAMFAAVISVCSLIYVPFAVPFTMQTFAVFLALFSAGGKRGTIAILTYIAIGLAGMPVFSGFMGGVSALFGATGGYIIGFVFAAFIYWLFEKLFGKSEKTSAVSAIVGMTVCYIFGSLWYAFVFSGGTGEAGFFAAIAQCVLPFILPDAAKITLAFVLCKRLKKYMK